MAPLKLTLTSKFQSIPFASNNVDTELEYKEQIIIRVSRVEFNKVHIRMHVTLPHYITTMWEFVDATGTNHYRHYEIKEREFDFMLSLYMNNARVCILNPKDNEPKPVHALKPNVLITQDLFNRFCSVGKETDMTNFCVVCSDGIPIYICFEFFRLFSSYFCQTLQNTQNMITVAYASDVMYRLFQCVYDLDNPNLEITPALLKASDEYLCTRAYEDLKESFILDKYNAVDCYLDIPSMREDAMNMVSQHMYHSRDHPRWKELTREDFDLVPSFNVLAQETLKKHEAISTNPKSTNPKPKKRKRIHVCVNGSDCSSAGWTSVSKDSDDS